MYAAAFPQSSPLNDFFSTGSRWNDNPNPQINLRSPDFWHKISKESLCGWDNPCWFQEVLQSRGLPHADKLEYGDLGNEKDEKEEIKAKDAYKPSWQQEVLYSSSDKHEKSQDDPETAVSLVASLKSCANQKELLRGRRVHADVVKNGLLEKNVFVGSALVSMYAKCAALDKAQELFDELPVLNVVSWNALITGYVQHGHGEKALYCFERMNLGGFNPDEFTFSCILKACGDLRAYDRGRDLHALILGDHLLGKSAHVGTALVSMYAKCGALEKAQEVFNELQVPNIVSWNVLIGGYAHNGHSEEALNCYGLMQSRGLAPHPITFAYILKACGGIGALDKGQEIHSQIVKNGLLEENVILGNALIDMYAKCGILEKAQEVFNELLVWDVVSWNALIGGYTLYGDGERALNCFESMQQEGYFPPDVVTFACILKACGSLGTSYKGQELHAEIVKYGLMEKAVVIDMALVEMYANCGMLVEAHDLFDKLPVRDVVSWSALMVGYAHLGQDDVVFSLLDAMIGEGTKPDMVTFTIVLNTCSHRGLLNEGQMYFEFLSKDYCNMPILEHHTCMVDLFSRAGRLDKAIAVIEEMPFAPNLKLWDTLLGACQIWGNLKVGQWAFQQAVQVDEKTATAYVGMRNIYAAALRYRQAKSGRRQDVVG